MVPPILFYSVGEAYGEFSNSAAFPITPGKKKWPTSEHCYQAQKFENPADREEVRKDWEAVKVGIMRQALEAKFAQHGELEALRLSTGTAKLVEHTNTDSYRGDGGDGTGKNMLGLLLMELRNNLSSHR